MAFSFNLNQEHDLTYYKKRFWKIFFYFLGGLTLFFLFASWGLFG